MNVSINERKLNVKKQSLMWYKPWTPFLFILPALLGLLIFRLYPMLFSFLLSFTEWNIITSPKFIGLENYKELISSSDFYLVLKNTIIFSAIYVIGVMTLGLGLALLVNKHIKGVNFFRVSFYLPVITSTVAVGIVWKWILAPKYGILNIFLEKIGITPPYWYSDASFALYTVAFVFVWKMSGYYMILYLAGLKQIPEVLKEAAVIDGASQQKIFWKITLPMLSSTSFFVLITSIIHSFRNFEIIYAMTLGGPQNSSSTLVYSIYLNAFNYSRLGYASSIAYFLLLIIGGITLINFYFKRRWVQSQY